MKKNNNPVFTMVLDESGLPKTLKVPLFAFVIFRTLFRLPASNLEYSERLAEILIAIWNIPNGDQDFGGAFGMFQIEVLFSGNCLEYSKKEAGGFLGFWGKLCREKVIFSLIS